MIRQVDADAQTMVIGDQVKRWCRGWTKRMFLHLLCNGSDHRGEAGRRNSVTIFIWSNLHSVLYNLIGVIFGWPPQTKEVVVVEKKLEEVTSIIVSKSQRG